VVFRFGSVSALSTALSDTRGSLPLPEGESVGDGEWVLAIFEIGSRRRATAAAARGVRAAGDIHLEFERRDWDRLVGFVAARSDSPSRPGIGRPQTLRMRPVSGISSTKVPVAPSVSTPPAGNSSSIKVPTAPAISGVSSAKVPVAPQSSYPDMLDAPPRSRRFEDLPPSSALESSRIPFGARILVIDDQGGSGDELRAMLAEMGLVAELASTAKRAEERMSGQAFDALVLDLHAPGMDSRAFVSKLRGDARLGDIPVLFLSSRPTSRDVVDAFASGGDDFLPKPFRTPELAARIFGLLRRARLARGLETSR
jgi:two-component system, OmpR family, phosphate regulon response regulator PhoB